jgi:manganese/zinc/iron transport system permease protein
VTLILDHTVITVLVGVIMLGALAGSLGVFVLLRGQSLLGDAIAHAALPGIAGSFLITHSKYAPVLLAGGAISGAVGMLLVDLVTRSTRLKQDAAQGMVLSIFFGLGLVLLTVIQKQPISHQAVLNKFLFGNVSTLLQEELYIIAGFSFAVFLCLALFWKELVAFSFDAAHVSALGFGNKRIPTLLAGMLLATIVIGLQVVGVILMSTLLIAPAAAARQWTSSAARMLLISALCGVCSGVGGVLVSVYAPAMPTGPVIVVLATLLFLFSLLFAPYRGLLYIRKPRKQE